MINPYYRHVAVMFFIIILFLILLGGSICNIIPITVVSILTGNKKTDSNIFSGGFKGKPDGIKNILIVDVANMYVGWYMEKYKKCIPYNQQYNLMEGYIKCISDHYKRFVEKNDTKTDTVNYIIKNYKYIDTSKKMIAPVISKKTWNKIYAFVKEHLNAHITVAEDYNKIPHHLWKSEKMHYLRGRDDYLCFRMAQQYKKKYINAIIMSDDKYRDYEQFGYVPEFKATYIYSSRVDDIGNTDIVQSQELITPRPNTLGQMIDYTMVNITMEFDFNDNKILKNTRYKIADPGSVWSKKIN